MVSFSVSEPPAKDRLQFSVQHLFCLTFLGSAVLSIHPQTFWHISIMKQRVMERKKKLVDVRKTYFFKTEYFSM